MKLNLENDNLIIDLEWYEKFWAVTLNKQIQIPLSHIVGVASLKENRVSTTEPSSNWSDLRAPGSFLPGIIKAGTYYTKQGKEFWYAVADKNYLTLELHDEPYRRLIITIPDNIYWYNSLSAVGVKA
jgi:hypothetical protein